MAPHTGRRCLELVGTVQGRFSEQPVDRIAEPDDLLRWLAALDLVPTRPPRRGEVAAFHELREALFRLMCALSEGKRTAADRSTHAEDVELVNRYAGTRQPVVTLRLASAANQPLRLAATSGPPTVAQTLALLAGDAVDLLSGPDVQRLHQCQADHCGTFYLDTSRGGQRRWCSSATCGNRARVAAFRDRNRS